MPINSILAKISSYIEASKGSAALAEKELWNLVHTESELLPDKGAHDLAVVAGNLSATGLQMRAHLEVVQSFITRVMETTKK